MAFLRAPKMQAKYSALYKEQAKESVLGCASVVILAPKMMLEMLRVGPTTKR